MQTQIEQLYIPLILYVKKRVNNNEDAEDITQEIFYKLSKSNSVSVVNLKSWVYTIAKNTITDYYRKHKIDTVGLESHAMYEEGEDESAARELGSCVGSYINMLPEEYRSLMIMSELENVPQKEIAHRLNMNYVTLRSKIQRGRKKLKDMFTDCCTIVQGSKGSILEYISKEDLNQDQCNSCN